MVFFDTSIVIAHYLPERYSGLVEAQYSANPQPTISSYVELEVMFVLSRLIRTNELKLALRHRRVELSLSDAQQIAALFAKHLAEDLYQSVPLSAGVYRLARDYIARFDLPLKAPDALHLAVAATERLPLVTADRQLARNAEALGLTAELLESSAGPLPAATG
ncbi:MAG: type II toxin-antitoxin system VapC family toxin [Caldilineaceae bacterium]